MFKHFVSASQFASPDHLHAFFDKAKRMETPWMYGRDPIYMARGNIMASFFAEPSTRTRTSFESAMQRLGGSVVSTAGNDSSLLKGESWVDTVRTLSQVADIIVARTPNEGDAANAAAVSRIPFINAGDGKGEHPTQALLDLYTIWKHFDTIDGISVGLVGDLKYSRTIHSLLKLLNLYKNVTYHIVAPDRLMLDPREYLKNPAIHFRVHKSVDELVAIGPHVVYLTRNQQERRAEDFVAYNPRDHHFNLRHAEKLPENSIILHPLPRGQELAPEVDADRRALYWQQVKNGLYVRMALLEAMLEENG
jgi:aspartate carbamoyltransferase catalytic subunit